MRESIAETTLRGIHARIERARARLGAKPRSRRGGRSQPPSLPSEDAVERETLPAADPIAYLGTQRHPVNEVPATSALPSLRIDSTPPVVTMPPVPVASDVDASRKLSRVHPGVVLIAGAALLSTMLFAASRIHHTGVTDVARNERTSAAPVANANPVPTLPPSVAEGAPLEAATSAPFTVNPSVKGVAGAHESAPSAAPDVEIPPVHIDQTTRATSSSAIATARRAPPPLTAFDFAAAMNAVTNAGVGANDCGPEATGSVPVAVTFAPGGFVTHAVVENGALRGTAAGSCVARQLRSVRVAPFQGRTATVRTTVVLR